MSVTPINTINNESFAYLSVGLSTANVPYSDQNRKKFVSYIFFNVSANTKLFKLSRGNIVFIPYAISWYILRIRVEWTILDGSCKMIPNPIVFGPSFPGKKQSKRLLFTSTFDVPVQLTNDVQIHDKRFRVSIREVEIQPYYAKEVGVIIFDPSLLLKYGNYVYFNGTWDSNKSKTTNWNYLNMNMNMNLFSNLNSNSRFFGIKEPTAYELAVENRRHHIWQQMLNNNLTTINTVISIWSPTIGRLPLFVQASLKMPRLVVNNVAFGSVIVGEISKIFVLIHNIYDQIVKIELIEPVNNVVFSVGDNRYNKRILILKPYQRGQLGPIIFRPSFPGQYSNIIYIRNNITVIESFSVNGTGLQGHLMFQSKDIFSSLGLFFF